MADFLDEFEVSFMEGYEGEVEKTRGFVYEANMALDKLRKEDWVGDKSTVALFQVMNGAWGRARDAFDAVHALRSAQAAHVARQLSEGRCVEEELDADLVPVAGWTAALESSSRGARRGVLGVILLQGFVSCVPWRGTRVDLDARTRLYRPRRWETRMGLTTLSMSPTLRALLLAAATTGAAAFPTGPTLETIDQEFCGDIGP